jgi:hypothetical protein
VPALPSSVLEPLWVQVAALLPARQDAHPLGCHRPTSPTGLSSTSSSNSWCLAAATAASPTRPARRPPCAAAATSGSTPASLTDGTRLALAAYDRMHGLELEHLAVDGRITKAPYGGQVAGPSLVDRRTQVLKRSVATEAHGGPLGQQCRPRPTAAMMGCWPPLGRRRAARPAAGAAGGAFGRPP